MKRTTTLGIAMISLLFFTACKKEASINIDQNRIYSDYKLTYSQASNQTVMQATFRVDHNSGQKIELTYPARIGFNDENLGWRNLGGRYEGTRSGNQLNGHFTYFDVDQNNYVNTGSTVNPIDVPFGINNINKNGNFFLPWTGAVLQSGETVKVIISGGSQTGSKTFTATAIGSSFISLEQYKLNQLVAGTAQIQIQREIVTGLEQSNLSGGRVTSIYKGRKVTINITE
jgi:hypothetical protein